MLFIQRHYFSAQSPKAVKYDNFLQPKKKKKKPNKTTVLMT